MSYQYGGQQRDRPLHGFNYGESGAQLNSEDGSRWSPEAGDVPAQWRLNDRPVTLLDLEITFDTLSLSFQIPHRELTTWREEYEHAGDISKKVGSGGRFRHISRSESDLEVEIRPPEELRPIPFETETYLVANYGDSPAYESPEIYEVSMEFARPTNRGPRVVTPVEYTPPPSITYSEWGQYEWGEFEWGGTRTVSPQGTAEAATDGSGDREDADTARVQAVEDDVPSGGRDEAGPPTARSRYERAPETRREQTRRDRPEYARDSEPDVPPESVGDAGGGTGRRRESATAALTGSGPVDTERRTAPTGPTREGGPAARRPERTPAGQAALVEYIRRGPLSNKGREVNVGRGRPDRRPIPERWPPGRGDEQGGGWGREGGRGGAPPNDVPRGNPKAERFRTMPASEESDRNSGISLQTDGGEIQEPIGPDEWLFEFPTDEVVLDSRNVSPSEGDARRIEETDLTLRMESPEIVPILESPTYLDALSEQSIPDGDDLVNDGSGGRNSIVIHAPVWSEIASDLYIVSDWSISPFAVNRWEVDLTVQPVPEYRNLDIVEPGKGFGLSAFGMSPFGE